MKLTLLGSNDSEKLHIDCSLPGEALVLMFDSHSGTTIWLTPKDLKTLHSWLGMVLQDMETKG